MRLSLTSKGALGSMVIGGILMLFPPLGTIAGGILLGIGAGIMVSVGTEKCFRKLLNLPDDDQAAPMPQGAAQPANDGRGTTHFINQATPRVAGAASLSQVASPSPVAMPFYSRIAAPALVASSSEMALLSDHNPAQRATAPRMR